MKFKKTLLVFCLIMCILFTVSSIAAGDVNETAIASDDTIANEETLTTEEISDDALAIDENNEDVLNIDQNDADTIIAEDTEKDETVLTVKNTDEDVLSYGMPVKVNIYKQTGKYANDKKIYIKVTNAETGEGVCEWDFGIKVHIYDYKTNKEVEDVTIPTNSNGIGVLEWSNTLAGDGVFKIEVAEFFTLYDNYPFTQSSKTTAKVTVAKNKVTIKANKLTVPKKSKKKFAIKVTGQDKKPVWGACLEVKVYTGNKAKAYYIWTNKKGVANFDKVSKLSNGKHKVKISLAYSANAVNYCGSYGLYAKSISSSITVGKTSKSKMSVTIKAKGLSATYKSGKYFKAKVINSKTNKPVKGVKVTLNVFTGKKAKTVTLTSNSKGIIKYSSSKLKVGKHNVVLKVKKSKSFTGKTKKSYIKISKKKSSSNTAKKGKTSTTITCKGSILKNSYTYQSGYYTSPRGQEPLYNTAYYPSVSITPTLKGSNGKEIKGKYKATLNYYDSDGELYHSETFDGTFGQYKSYTGSNGGWKYNLKISYSGNSKYRASSFTTSITMNNHGPVKM